MVKTMKLKPYYQDDFATIYHGDCREILPQLDKVDLVLTDPPYPSYLTSEYCYTKGLLSDILGVYNVPQIIFWTPSNPFPLDFTACYCWDKAIGTHTMFELIYFRGISCGYRIVKYISPHNTVRARFGHDECHKHPSQKPIQLIYKLAQQQKEAEIILDPFMGSGTTLVAAKQLRRKAIGIEISKEYCDIAVKRLSQEVLPL